MTLVAPSILSADFSNLSSEIKKVEKYADLLHVDVMDGHFVPNITFGPPVVSSISKISSLPLDVHLMIENPDKYIEAFCTAGANIISFHIETVRRPLETISLIHKMGAKASVAVNPSTPVNILDGLLEHLDMVLLMTVNPGFGGQSFIRSVIPKIKSLRKTITKEGYNLDIEVDGGINAATGKEAKLAGANILVAGSYIYGSKDVEKSIKMLK